MKLNGVGEKDISSVRKTDNKDVQNKQSDLTLARALADGNINFHEKEVLYEGGKYNRDELASFWKGSFSEKIKKELLSAGYTEKDIENLSKEMLQNNQETYMKPQKAHMGKRESFVKQEAESSGQQFGV